MMVQLPQKSGWYWIKMIGYESCHPAYFILDKGDNPKRDSYFLVGGLGDSSSNGTFLNEIEKIGDEIFEPVL